MSSWTFPRLIKCLAFAGVTVLAAGSANAGYTKVNHTVAAGAELGHAAILSHAYGGTFAADGVNFTNGTLTAERCEDFGGNGGKPDQCWAGDVISARVIARFAGYEQSLGILDGDRGRGTFRELFAVSGTGLDVAGSASGLGLAGQPFRFARGGGGDLMTSLDLDNLNASDQMVSYRVGGTGDASRFVLFFEDVALDAGSDRDFNDLVVEVTVAAPPTAIPLPPAVWSGLAVLLGGAWGARARLGRWVTA